MKILIIGGHLTPALSVIELLPKDAEVIYVGRRHAMEGDKAQSLEFDTINKLGITFVELRTGRLQRNFTRHTIPSIGRIPLGMLRAIRILRKYKPHVVLSFGGYLSVPVIYAANLLRIPSVIHEQTLHAGSANKFASKYATKVCISFQSSARFFPKDKTVLTGNPIRDEILHPSKKFDFSGTEPIIYITGGNQGSHFINMLIQENLPQLLEKYRIVHQTGGSEEFRDFDKLSILRDGLNSAKKDKYLVSKYFSPDQIGSIMKAASLVVSRAGINTVSELIVLKKPGFLIPIPNTSANEQVENAMFFNKLGLGEMEEQKDLNPQIFILRINDMMDKLENYQIREYKTQFPKNAAKSIIDIVYATAKASY